jgi:hypothetical protein
VNNGILIFRSSSKKTVTSVPGLLGERGRAVTATGQAQCGFSVAKSVCIPPTFAAAVALSLARQCKRPPDRHRKIATSRTKNKFFKTIYLKLFFQ